MCDVVVMYVNGIAPLKYKPLKNFSSRYYPDNHQNIHKN